MLYRLGYKIISKYVLPTTFCTWACSLSGTIESCNRFSGIDVVRNRLDLKNLLASINPKLY